MPSMSKAQREGAAIKRATAILMGQRETGVTDAELATAVDSMAVGAMAAIFSRMKKANHMQPTGNVRSGRKIWKTTAAGIMAYSRNMVEALTEGAKAVTVKKKAKTAVVKKKAKAAVVKKKAKTAVVKKKAKTPVAKKKTSVVDIRREVQIMSEAAQKVSREAVASCKQSDESDVVFMGSLEVIGGLRHMLAGVEKMIRSTRKQ